MKKHYLFGISILTMLGAIHAAASGTESTSPDEGSYFAATPLEIAHQIRSQVEEAAALLAREAQVESLQDTMNHTQFLLTGESEYLPGEPEMETEYAEETETELAADALKEAETEIWPVDTGTVLPSDTAPADVAAGDASEDAQAETESPDGGADSDDAAAAVQSARHGVLYVPGSYSLNIARVSLYDYRMLRAYPLTSLPKDMHRLYDQVRELVSGFDGEWSVYVQNLSTDQTMVLNDKPMHSASVMKLFIMETVYEAFDNGTMTRGEDTVYLLRNMIINSSNDSSNRLLTLLGDGDLASGIARVNDFIARHGYTPQTAIHNGFQDPATALNPDQPNKVRARDVGLLLSRVYNREFISRKVCSEIEQMMLEQGTRYKIPRGLPDGVEVGNKSGETSDTANDAAVVYSSSADYILVVLSHGWGDENTANENVVKVSSLVYHFFAD